MTAINPAPARPARSLSSRVGRATAGVAVAACVAVVAIVGLRYQSLHQESAPGPAEIVPPVSALHAPYLPFVGKVTDATWNGTSPEVRAELGNYVITHAETSAVFSQQNILPYFFVATFDIRSPPARLLVPPRKR